MRVVAVANGLHLRHVVLADALIPRFVEDDAGIVAIVDRGVAHDLDTLLPLAAAGVLL